jgi:hypothetical protein
MVLAEIAALFWRDTRDLPELCQSLVSSGPMNKR